MMMTTNESQTLADLVDAVRNGTKKTKDVALLVAGGEVSLGDLAAALGIELTGDGCLVLPSEPITADDGNASVEYDADEHSPKEAAQQYVEDGEWGTIDETTWIDVATWRCGIDADGDVVQSDREDFTITLNPAEPECCDGQEHDWQSPHDILGGIKENPGCWGHGGGVIAEEVCIHCGCSRTTDTWAQRRETGEQGLRSVSYQPGKYADQIASSEE
jgi:hypothetical protein